MSLNWTIEQVRNWQEVRKNVVLNNAVDSMIWMTMAIGINEITDENREEVYLRIKLMEGAKGLSYSYSKDQLRKYPDIAKHVKTATRMDGQFSAFSQEVINRLVGLKTNASIMSREKFLRSILPAEPNKARSKAIQAFELRNRTLTLVDVS